MASNRNDIHSDYLKSLYGIEPLTIPEEHELARRIALGDDVALEKLVTHNLRFVPYVLKTTSYWIYGSAPIEDLLAIGNEMLLIAAKRWKPHKGIPFAGYARPFIVRGVQRELDNTSNAIRLPINIMEAIKRMNYQEQALTQALGREPSVGELADVLGVSAGKVHQLKGYLMREPISLDNIEQDKHKEESEE